MFDVQNFPLPRGKYTHRYHSSLWRLHQPPHLKRRRPRPPLSRVGSNPPLRQTSGLNRSAGTHTMRNQMGGSVTLDAVKLLEPHLFAINLCPLCQEELAQAGRVKATVGFRIHSEEDFAGLLKKMSFEILE